MQTNKQACADHEISKNIWNNITNFFNIFSELFQDFIKFLCQFFQSKATLTAENMFLRKQLAMYEERKIKPKRATNAIRIAMAWLFRLFYWKNSLIAVKPETLIRWHCNLFKLFWKLKSKGGRSVIPEELQLIIRQMHRDNPTWGEERIANELKLKLGIRVSPRSVAK